VTVQAGDTLWGLAEEHLGNGDRWPEIYALNRAVVGADPDVIQPAQRLRLPAKEM
jgi:nucleoid-associated protein YgaU